MAADHRTPSAVNALKQRLETLESERPELLAELARLHRNEDAVVEAGAASAATGSVNAGSDAAAKIELFRSLFRGREDVFPRRWQNANSGKSGYSPVCRNEWVRGICEKPRVKCGECPHQAFVAVTDNVIRCHLQGTDRDSSGRGSGSEYIAGVYPLLPDETCWFLAIDFDKQSWQIDARAFVDACRAHEIDAALPRSADAERDRRHSDFASDRVSTVKTLSRLTVKLAGARTRWDVEVANTTTRAFVPVAIYRGLLPSSEIF